MFSGLQEAVLKNIDACKELSLLTKSSMGPNGEQLTISRSLLLRKCSSHSDHGIVSSPCGDQSISVGHAAHVCGAQE
jgi:hypothetical protein